jgi:hypothetical protein
VWAPRDGKNIKKWALSCAIHGKVRVYEMESDALKHAQVRTLSLGDDMFKFGKLRDLNWRTHNRNALAIEMRVSYDATAAAFTGRREETR